MSDPTDLTTLSASLDFMRRTRPTDGMPMDESYKWLNNMVDLMLDATEAAIGRAAKP